MLTRDEKIAAFIPLSDAVSDKEQHPRLVNTRHIVQESEEGLRRIPRANSIQQVSDVFIGRKHKGFKQHI